MRDRKKRNIIIGSLCCLLVFMAAGYALLKQVLNINGTATLTGDWNIEITNITTKSIVGTAENAKDANQNPISPTFTSDSATFVVNFLKPGDKIVYEVTVENKGSIDAVLSLSSKKTGDNKDIVFYNNLESGQILKQKTSKTFEVVAEFSSAATTIGEATATYSLELTYTQYDGNIFYDPPKNVEIDNGVFQVSGDGTILNYNAELGDSVSIPAIVDNTPITSIASDAFKETVVTYNYDVKLALKSNGNSATVIYALLFDASKKDAVLQSLNQMAAQSGMTITEDMLYNLGDELPTDAPDFYYYLNLEKNVMHAVGPNGEDPEGDFLGETTTTKTLTLKSLDLSNATNLEKIEDFAFSNADETTADIDSIEPGLTSLTLGNNMNDIDLGIGAFAGADIDELILYTSFKSGVVPGDVYIINSEGTLESYTVATLYIISPFAGANIDRLIIKATPEYSSTQTINYEASAEYGGVGLYIGTYQNATIGSLYIEEGITEISDMSFGASKISNLSLPSTLTTIGKDAFAYDYGDNSGAALTSINLPSKLKTIGDNAFRSQNITGTLIIPSSVTSIGSNAFTGNTALTNIIQKKNGSTCNTLGTSWYSDSVTYTCE